MSTFLRGRLSDVPVILTRWFLVIVVSYALIFSAEGVVPLWPHQVFIAVILVSNLVLAWVLSRGRSWGMLSGWATALDIAAVTMAISVAGNLSAEFFLVFFAVLIVAAVIERRDLLAVLAVVTCASYGAFLWAEAGNEVWRSSALLIRLPVLYGVAVYFGTAVQAARRELRAQAEQVTIERGRALSALTAMGNVALSGGHSGRVLYELARWVQETVRFDRCSLLVFGEIGDPGYLAASGDDPGIEVLTIDTDDYPELGPTLRTGEFTEVHPGQPAELWEQVRTRLPEGSPFASFIVVPIKRPEGVIGALYLRDSDPERTLSEAMQGFCHQAAQMASSLIHEHDLRTKLEAAQRALGEVEDTAGQPIRTVN